MGRGGDRASQGLVIDVGHVRQRLAHRLERRAHRRHRRAGGELGLQRGRVVIEQAAEVTERHQGAIGWHQGAEGMRRADRAYFAGGLADDLDQLVQALRRQPRFGQAALRAGPVAPGNQPWRAQQLRQRRVAGQRQQGAGRARLLQPAASREVDRHGDTLRSVEGLAGHVADQGQELCLGALHAQAHGRHALVAVDAVIEQALRTLGKAWRPGRRVAGQGAPEAGLAWQVLQVLA